VQGKDPTRVGKEKTSHGEKKSRTASSIAKKGGEANPHSNKVKEKKKRQKKPIIRHPKKQKKRKLGVLQFRSPRGRGKKKRGRKGGLRIPGIEKSSLLLPEKKDASVCSSIRREKR